MPEPPHDLCGTRRWCLGPDSNRHAALAAADFKSAASTDSATEATRGEYLNRGPDHRAQRLDGCSIPREEIRMKAIGRCALAFVVLLLTVPAFAATRSWTGGGGNVLWSNPANWQGNVAPIDGDDLVFTVGDTPTLATTNDFPLITLHSISAVKRNVDFF